MRRRALLLMAIMVAALVVASGWIAERRWIRRNEAKVVECAARRVIEQEPTMHVLRSVLGRLGTRTKEGAARPFEGTPPKAEQVLRQLEKTGKRPEGRLPDFLLLGAQKGGTSFLFKLLS
jgi:hypothetical protein